MAKDRGRWVGINIFAEDDTPDPHAVALMEALARWREARHALLVWTQTGAHEFNRADEALAAAYDAYMAQEAGRG